MTDAPATDADAGGPSAESFERLASRLALLVSSENEADNAGRAAGALARRLGLSGGQLKAMFLAGAAATVEVAPRVIAQAGAVKGAGAINDAGAVERETAMLRHTAEQLDLALRQVSRERDVLRHEVGQLGGVLDGLRASARFERIIGGVLAAAMVGGMVFVALSVGWPARDPGGAQGHTAVVRDSGAVIYAQADTHADVLGRLPPGSRVELRQLVWHHFAQWAEAGGDGQIGFISVSDLDLP